MNFLSTVIEKSISSAKTIKEKGITKEEAYELVNIKNSNILTLVDIANRVRSNTSTCVNTCTILNAKSGECSQNCSFCSQSKFSNSKIDTYPLLNREQILKSAQTCVESGVNNFGIITSGYGFKNKDDKEFNYIVDSIIAIKAKYPNLKLCASLGVLTQKTAQILADAGVYEYNHNLQTAPDKYKTLISSTHTVNERIETIKHVKNAGMLACCGGILGVGETNTDRVDFAFALKELNVDIIPLNILVPIKGTKLENHSPPSAAEIIKTVAIFRIINPDAIIKIAAGRESYLSDFQGLALLAGANGIITGGYLTTRGRDVEKDKEFISHIEEFYG